MWMERVAALQGPSGLVSYQRIIKFIWREVVVSLSSHAKKIASGSLDKLQEDIIVKSMR